MKLRLTLLAGLLLTTLAGYPTQRIYDAARLGLKPGVRSASPLIGKILDKIRREYREGDTVILRFAAGRYDFHPEGAAEREYYISNHDQTNPKRVGIALEGFTNLTLDAPGAEFVFHGQMLPLSLVNSRNCTLRGFGVDFENPHISQVRIVANDPEEGITFEVAPWVNYRISTEGLFESFGEGWAYQPSTGIAFEPETRRVVYRTSDLSFSTRGVTEIAPRRLIAPEWKDERLVPGTVVAMRSWFRPAPGILLSCNHDTRLEHVTVHYAEGMGLLAQLCENITLDGFRVCLRDHDPRYFTAQADATHFSGCKGKIISRNGLYENMMDDAINIHGTYLKVVNRLDDRTLIGRYMHDQSWGFRWGDVGDEVQFIRSATMELTGGRNRIAEIAPYDKATTDGAREFRIVFAEPLDPAISEAEGFGIENLTWAPEVVFAGNIVRNNRARGALFSTPQPTLVEDNLFDHTSGTAILLCGDCNGWYETGACRDVTIRRNRFVNALTNLFQFTNAVISIYPEIPDLAGQQQYFHGGPEGGVVIEENEFDTFDAPILYAKSVDGLIFRNNTIRTNHDYPPFHWNRSRFLLERVNRAQLE